MPKGNAFDIRWNKYFEALVKYKHRNGGSVSVRKDEDWDAHYGGLNLHKWTTNQATYLRNKLGGKLPSISDEREAKLRSIGFFVRSAPASTKRKMFPWDQALAFLVKYRDRNGGSLNVTMNCDWEEEFEGMNLYAWTCNQKSYYRRGTLQKDRCDKLELIGFDFGPARSGGDSPARPPYHPWDDNYELMVELLRGQGQTLEQIEASNPRLRQWIQEQKLLYSFNESNITTTLTADRVAKLREIGFDFTSPALTTRPDSAASAASNSSSRSTSPAQQQQQQQQSDDEAANNEARRANDASAPEEEEEQHSPIVPHAVANGRSEPPLIDESASEDEDEFRIVNQAFMEDIDNEIVEAEEKVMFEEMLFDIIKAEESCAWLEKNTCIVFEIGTDDGSFGGHKTINESAGRHLQRRLASVHGSSPAGNVDMVCARKRIPMFYDGTSDYVLTDQELQGQLIPDFRRKNKSLDFKCFSAVIDETQDSRKNLVVVVQGQAETVDRFSNLLEKVLNSKKISHKYKLLLSMGRRVKFKFDLSKRLGAELVHPPLSRYQGLLLNVKESDSSCQLARSLGMTTFEQDAAVVKAGGRECWSAKSFRHIQDQHTKKKRPAMWLELTVSNEMVENNLHQPSEREARGEDDEEQEEEHAHTEQGPALPREPEGASEASTGQSEGNSKKRAHSSIADREGSLHVPKKARKRTQDGEKNQFREYSLEFTSKEPLGFYCDTVKDHDGSICKILSVNPTGQAKTKDPRITAGTVVVGASLSGQEPQKIQSCHGLKASYEDARKQNRAISLYFINSHVSEASASRSETPHEWKDSYWKGNFRGGWAGGSVDWKKATYSKKPHFRHKPSSSVGVSSSQQRSGSAAGDPVDNIHHGASGPKRPHSQYSRQYASDTTGECAERNPDRARDTEQRHSQSEISRAARSSDNQQCSTDADWVEVITDSLSAWPSRPEPKRGILISAPKSKSSAKRVQLNLDLQIRKFHKDRPFDHFEVPAASRAGHTESLSPLETSQSTPETSIGKDKALHQSIRQGSFKDTLLLLKDGAAAEMSSEDMTQLRKYVKDESVRTRANSNMSPMNREAMLRDLRLKDVLLKIYINAEHILRKSKAVKYLISFNISLVQIENLCPLPPFSFKAIQVHASKCQPNTKPFQLPNCPYVPFSDAITFSNASNIVKYNPFLPDEMKGTKLQLDLDGEMVLPDNRMVRLGKAEVLLPWLYDKCQHYNSDWEGSFDIEPSAENYIARGAVAKIEARRHAVDEGDKHEKRKDEMKRVRSVIEWIERFNLEVKDEGGDCFLPADIRVRGGSLLHAAIYLQSLEDVQKLIDRGADPLAEHLSFASALQLAMNMAQRDGPRNQDGLLHSIVRVMSP